MQEEHRVVARMPAQWAFEVIMFRDRMPRGPGNRPPGAEQVANACLDNVKFSRDQETVSKTCVDDCITIHERMLHDNDIAACIMEATSLWGHRSPFDAINKLRIICFKARARDNTFWVIAQALSTT